MKINRLFTVILVIICEVISHASCGYHHQHSRIIIVEDAKACFRRALAGKRVTRSLVRRALSCGRVEDCQVECQDEKRFVCEGFNYRLDPTGRGNGDCELLDLPVIRLDMRRDIYPDPDYDVYEKDRNGYPDCKMGGYDYAAERDRHRYYLDDAPPVAYDYNRRSDYHRFGAAGDHDRRHPPTSNGYLPRRDENRRYDYGDAYLPERVPPSTGRDKNPWGLQGSNAWSSYGSSSFHTSFRGYGTYEGQSGPNKGIASPYDVPAGDTYVPKPSLDFVPKRPSYLPETYPKSDSEYNHYGVYGNSYGGSYGTTPPSFGIVIPINSNTFGVPKPSHPNVDVPITEDTYAGTNGETVEHKDGSNSYGVNENKRIGYNFFKEECSLRSATGFRLHKIIVRKLYSVPDIYECETLCFKEKDFDCHSYAYRYTLTSTTPTDNCYLSNKNYKQLDFYTDLEPDRDFDVYTMNNRKKCEEQIPKDKEHSDCFWHTRSGQRLDQDLIRESTQVKSIVECQIACLRAVKFLCRGFSFRYGSPIIGGEMENCLLTDWPFKEIDPGTHFSNALGFEIYERGSFGHGCEPNHFEVRGKEQQVIGSKTDQLCYVGYGTPARLLPDAIRKSVMVDSELDCKGECTKYRYSSLFQCMSFSYRSKAPRGTPNCELSDILQRDLLDSVDYTLDRDSWLFAWDNYNPECVPITNTKTGSRPSPGAYNHQEPSSYGTISHGYTPGRNPPALHGYHNHESGFYGYHGHSHSHSSSSISNHGSHQEGDYSYGTLNALDTWRVYSVSGWPCKRGALCRENREAGFWYCDLEGGDSDTWDYCCRPDHQCGYSEGYNYQWCYVGPERTQWRKCSERYYPYVANKPYLPDYNPVRNEGPPPYAERFQPSNIPPRPSFRPNRPLARPRIPPKMPSLNEYEQEFNMQFLDPPKPGGFGQARLWPVSYLHREEPPGAREDNVSEYKYERMQQDGRLSAIHNLITIIKSNQFKDIQYQLNNNDTRLLIQVPLPANITQLTNNTMVNANAKKMNLKEVNATRTANSTSTSMDSENNKEKKKSNITAREVKPFVFKEPKEISKHLSTQQLLFSNKHNLNKKQAYSEINDDESLTVPTYRKSYIVRTNRTDRELNIS